MKKEDFETMLTKLRKLIKQCSTQQNKINDVGGFENLTIKESNRITTDCKNFKINMDRVINTELYHIIGMGNLSAAQLQIFCKDIKKLCSYRYMVECISAMKVTVFTGHQESKYTCKELGVTFSATGKLGETVLKTSM